MLDQSFREIVIRCVAAEIPEHLEIDISNLGIGETIHVSDLSFDHVEVVTEGEVALVSVLMPMGEEAEEEDVGLAEEEPEIIGRSQEEEDTEEEEG